MMRLFQAVCDKLSCVITFVLVLYRMTHPSAFLLRFGDKNTHLDFYIDSGCFNNIIFVLCQGCQICPQEAGQSEGFGIRCRSWNFEVQCMCVTFIFFIIWPCFIFFYLLFNFYCVLCTKHIVACSSISNVSLFFSLKKAIASLTLKVKKLTNAVERFVWYPCSMTCMFL